MLWTSCILYPLPVPAFFPPGSRRRFGTPWSMNGTQNTGRRLESVTNTWNAGADPSSGPLRRRPSRALLEQCPGMDVRKSALSCFVGQLHTLETSAERLLARPVLGWGTCGHGGRATLCVPPDPMPARYRHPHSSASILPRAVPDQRPQPGASLLAES
jgi:hypothetical protein